MTWEWMPEQEVRESQLLRRINEAVLWPLGLALTAFIEDDGSYQDRLRIQKIVPFDVIADGTPEEVEQSLLVFAEWMRRRLNEGKEPNP